MSADECPKCGTVGYKAKDGCTQPDCGHCEHVHQVGGTCVQCGETLYEVGEPVG